MYTHIYTHSDCAAEDLDSRKIVIKMHEETKKAAKDAGVGFQYIYIYVHTHTYTHIHTHTHIYTHTHELYARTVRSRRQDGSI